MVENIVTKSVVSVTEMARMVGLSRARFYQLVKRGTFPVSDLDPLSKRPCYCEEKQRLILEARRRNCGVDGVPLLFYARRKDSGQLKVATRPSKPKVNRSQYAELLGLLQQVKITMTAAQVETVVNELYPKGIDGIDPATVIAEIIGRSRRQNPADKVE